MGGRQDRGGRAGKAYMKSAMGIDLNPRVVVYSLATFMHGGKYPPLNASYTTSSI